MSTSTVPDLVSRSVAFELSRREEATTDYLLLLSDADGMPLAEACQQAATAAICAVIESRMGAAGDYLRTLVANRSRGQIGKELATLIRSRLDSAEDNVALWHR